MAVHAGRPMDVQWEKKKKREEAELLSFSPSFRSHRKKGGKREKKLFILQQSACGKRKATRVLHRRIWRKSNAGGGEKKRGKTRRGLFSLSRKPPGKKKKRDQSPPHLAKGGGSPPTRGPEIAFERGGEKIQRFEVRHGGGEGGEKKKELFSCFYLKKGSQDLLLLLEIPLMGRKGKGPPHTTRIKFYRNGRKEEKKGHIYLSQHKKEMTFVARKARPGSEGEGEKRLCVGGSVHAGGSEGSIFTSGLY